MRLQMTITCVLVVFTIFMGTVHCKENRPPQMQTSFMPEYYLSFGNKEALVLQCKATNGKITYTWEKDGKPLINSQYVQTDSDTGTITFRGITTPDYGQYQCFARNEFGVGVAPPFEMIRADMGTFAEGVNSQTCIVGDYCVITCPKVDSVMCVPKSKCRVRWFIGENLNKKVNADQRKNIGAEGNLIILKVEKEDGNKNYGCGIWNGETNTLQMGSRTSLTVVEQAISRTRTALLSSSSGKGLLYSKSTMTCVFGAIDYPTTTWYFGKDVIRNKTNKYSIEDYGRRLVIYNQTLNDEGTYKCVGNSSLLPGTGEVLNNITSAPRLSKQSTMNDKFTTVGKDVSFFCDARSLYGEVEPAPPIWTVNGTKITNEKYISSPDRKTLTIKNAQKLNDSASFQCMTTNSEGRLYISVFLMVVDPINLVKGFEPVYKIKPGEQAILQVEVTADPLMELRYIWSFVNVQNKTIPIQNDQFWLLSPDKRTLTITTDQNMGVDAEKFRQVFGHYVLKIYDAAQEIILRTDLQSSVKPPKPVVVPPPAEASPDLWFIALILGVIVLIVIIVLIICMLNRNRGGTYPVDKKEVAAGHDPEKELADSGFQDLSRADDDDVPKSDRVSLSDDFEKPLESDEDDMEEYGGDLDTSKFNEDGSFIGMYVDKKGKQSHTTQSTV